MFVKGIWDILVLYFFIIFISNVTYMGSFRLFAYQFIYAFPRVFYIAFVITNFVCVVSLDCIFISRLY
jgi:hypothetical protein